MMPAPQLFTYGRGQAGYTKAAQLRRNRGPHAPVSQGHTVSRGLLREGQMVPGA